MTITNLDLPFENWKNDISIEGNRISDISASNHDRGKIHLGDAIAFPGLVNMHDHLAMNLYPSFKSKTYRNYIEWSADLHHSNREIIEKIKIIPSKVLGCYGELKNLLSGFTTVSDHENTTTRTKVIDGFTDYNYLHSIQRHKNWRRKLLLTFNNKPWMTHLNEGFQDAVNDEVKVPKKWNILRRKIIAIHGISLSSEHLSSLYGLIWCPGSNKFLYEKTIDIDLIKGSQNSVFFGTDSTLTGSPNLWIILEMPVTGMEVQRVYLKC